MSTTTYLLLCIGIPVLLCIVVAVIGTIGSFRNAGTPRASNWVSTGVCESCGQHTGYCTNATPEELAEHLDKLKNGKA